MDERVHFITIATADLDAARRFYVDGLRWTPKLDVADEILFFQVAPGLMLGLFRADKFAEDIGQPGAEIRPSGLTLSHNVSSRAEVDQLLAAAGAAGGTITKPAQVSAFGGIYHGQLSDPNGTLWEIAHNPHWSIDEAGDVHLGESE